MLPRQRFLSFAQVELEVRLDRGSVVLRHLGMDRCSVDGVVARETAIAPGSHAIVIGEVELALELS